MIRLIKLTIDKVIFFAEMSDVSDRFRFGKVKVLSNLIVLFDVSRPQLNLCNNDT